VALSARITKKLKQLYGRKPGVKVGDPKKIKKTLASGTSIPQYRKKGGHVRKKK
tara:strand:- start:117 stop:278 length:162 start_codon:yes stop_codon:yes gene_type:complete